MRSMIFASLSLIFGAATAFAGDDPPQQPTGTAPVATTAAPSQAGPATPSSSAPAAPPSAPVGSQPTAAPAVSSTAAHASNPQELTDVDKKLIAQGYKMSVKDGQKTFCRREIVLGSHFEKKVCGTAESLGMSQQDSKDITQGAQLHVVPPRGN